VKRLSDKQEAMFWKDHCAIRKYQMRQQEKLIMILLGIILLFMIFTWYLLFIRMRLV
jgi:hypothetical protein